VEEIPPQNIFHFEKTNISNDPGSKKCLFEKGTCTGIAKKQKSNIFVLPIEHLFQ
jgi:hypothetical protein